MANAFGQFDGKPITTVRPFSIYGPGEANFRFIPTVCRQLINGKKINLAMGNHDWIYIDDFIEALLKITFSDNEYYVYNIGTGIESSNLDILSNLEKISGKKTMVEYINPIRTDDKSEHWVADITRLKALAWKPKFTIQQGLEATYKYYAKQGS